MAYTALVESQAGWYGAHHSAEKQELDEPRDDMELQVTRIMTQNLQKYPGMTF